MLCYDNIITTALVHYFEISNDFKKTLFFISVNKLTDHLFNNIALFWFKANDKRLSLYSPFWLLNIHVIMYSENQQIVGRTRFKK